MKKAKPTHVVGTMRSAAVVKRTMGKLRRICEGPDCEEARIAQAMEHAIAWLLSTDRSFPNPADEAPHIAACLSHDRFLKATS